MIRKETTKRTQLAKGTLKKMRKPLKERENGSKITQDPKNEDIKYVYKLVNLIYNKTKDKLDQITYYFLDLEKMFDFVKNEKITNFYIDTLFLEDKKPIF